MMPPACRRRVVRCVTIAALHSFCACAGFTTSGDVAVAQEPSDGPPPIQIEGQIRQPTIPDVPRDEVICFALYTHQDGVLKLSAQLYPLREGESRNVTLALERGDQWQPVATQRVDDQHWMTTFRVENWDSTRDARYRLTHAGGSEYEGLLRRDPIDKDEIVVAAFTGNSNRVRGMREDIVRNVEAQDPDLLFFSGDQSYDHRSHLAAWLLFGRQFGQIIRNRPTIAIPDDHDVGQGNLWGEAGKQAQRSDGSDGGYVMPVEYVNMVQRAQTAHLPDPADPTPVERGVTVYYTSLNVGGVDFAIVEDRKWKTGPAGLVPQQGPRPDHVNDPDYDPATIDLPEARQLGERQLNFLRQWGQDWRGVEMKAVLSQTIFAGGAHIHGRNTGRLLADLDSNGWPQSGRARAIREMRRCFAVHIAGDQHLATVIHHGVNHWEDGNWSFCVPSIVNYYGRWWWPMISAESGSPPPRGVDAAQQKEDLSFAGRHYDGFRNKLTMHAYANPTVANENGAGHGVIRFQKSTREITLECWPRRVDVTDSDAQQYPGWPIVIGQRENYGRAPIGYLPRLTVTGAEDPVVQVIDEALNEPVYTLRINGSEFLPPVYREGAYTIRVGDVGPDDDAWQEVKGVASTPEPGERELQLGF